ncbi:bleomycin resistance protein [Nitrincola sp. MINF-07-Sa-05]|uniref:bleomycin resistance protein n=1 Tax=Nitrincola salilacus TaxID=3400273 RepID=UPI0039185907
MIKSDVLPPLTPELKVRDVGKSLNFYTGLLGFSIRFERPEDGFAAIELNGACFMLEQIDEFDPDNEFWITAELEYPLGRGINFQITVVDLDEIHTRLLESDYPLKLPLEEVAYRVNNSLVKVHQFMVMDPDGYLLRFNMVIDK